MALKVLYVPLILYISIATCFCKGEKDKEEAQALLLPQGRRNLYTAPTKPPAQSDAILPHQKPPTGGTFQLIPPPSKAWADFLCSGAYMP